MTMFSQKAPFDLTEFLGKPATAEARRLTAAQRRFVRSGLEKMAAPPEAGPEPKPGRPKPGAKE